MATFFHGNPEIQATDGLQTLVLMNPTYVQYPDTPPPPGNNFVFLNSNSLSPHAPPTHTQQFVGIPLPTISASAHNPSSHDISPLHGLVQRVHYNMYNPMDPSGPARDTPRAQQGLSLSLSSQQQPLRFRSPAQAASAEDIRVSGGGGSATSGSVVTSGGFGMQGVLLGSKYLKAAQELLDEVVNVNKTEFAKKGSGNNNSSISKAAGESSAAAAGDRSPSYEAGVKRGSELSTAERQEIQMKKGKLISMLDEVEQRYRQYHHQMQIIINSFEQTAGVGSAKTYTALALQTISKQFRCLKDAITGQIGAANKSLGEEDSLGGRIEGSRLKFVDNQLRQQRALQQLGMIQHNAWRPQRGLPERSVSVLRSWLFEHFLHPYPKDADKVMLAKQTGLTRNQVSNWFINARVRLWKPMVEEMYTEEIKEREQNESEDKTSKSQNNEDSVSKSSVPQTRSPVSENHPKSFTTKQENSTTQNTTGISISTATTSPMSGNLRNQTGFSLIGSSELEGIAQRSPKKQRSSELLQSPISVHGNSANKQISMTFSGERLTRDGYSFMGNDTNFIGGFGQYPIGEITRFDAEQFTPRFSPGNGVSLTLGLPHCENLSLSGTHQTFLPNQNIQLGRRVEMSEPNEFGAINPSTTSAPYDNISIQNRKRFSAQLLPDFVS